MRPTHTASPLRCASAPNRAICAPKTPKQLNARGKIIGDLISYRNVGKDARIVGRVERTWVSIPIRA
jgi:hypothetical protein